MALEFNPAAVAAAAARLDDRSLHLWRLPYLPAQGRAPLLHVLSGYLGLPASAVILETDARGKPRFVPAVAHVAGGLQFNWSHSGDYALVALVRGGDVGVDIERLGKNLRALELARRFFDPHEADALAALDPVQRATAFIGLWCAKEAVLKATGKGLAFGLARLAFELPAAAAWQLARIDPELGNTRDWFLRSFDAAPGYRGALAWRGAPREVVAFQPSSAICM